MAYESKLFQVFGGLVLSGLVLAACGDDSSDGEEPSAEEGGSGGATGGRTATGGTGKGGASSSGGSANAAGEQSTAAGATSSDAGAGGDGNSGASGGEGTATGGTATGGSATGGSATGGSATGGSAGQPSSSSFGDCEAPAEPLEHCYADNDDRPGTGVCSEYYAASISTLFCTTPVEPGGCPRDEELEAVCLGGITSAYYYADSANEGFWDEGEDGCEINGGTWCSD